MIIVGKVMVCVAVALIVAAYTNFAPTALTSEIIGGYVKNHFVREMIFGTALATITIGLTVSASSKQHVWKIGVIGSVVVLPFWVAAMLGWSTGGLADVWGDKINADAAYILHGTQIAMFYTGLAVLKQALRN